jgi:hypothetical protein
MDAEPVGPVGSQAPVTLGGASARIERATQRFYP